MIKAARKHVKEWHQAHKIQLRCELSKINHFCLCFACIDEGNPFFSSPLPFSFPPKKPKLPVHKEIALSDGFYGAVSSALVIPKWQIANDLAVMNNAGVSLVVRDRQGGRGFFGDVSVGRRMFLAIPSVTDLQGCHAK